MPLTRVATRARSLSAVRAIRSAALAVGVAHLLAFSACGGGGGGAPASSADPAVTGFGAALGAPATAAIGSGGGSIATSDGAVTVTFPAGALAATTTFTLQPVENRAPGAVGPAFELTPRDVVLSKPVSVVVKLPAAAPVEQGAAALSVASQRDDGAWFAFQSGVDVQLAARVGTGASAAAATPAGAGDTIVQLAIQKLNRRATAIYAAIWLQPKGAQAHVSKTVGLVAVACIPTPATPAGAGEDDLIPLPTCKNAPVKANSTTATAGSLVEGATAHFTYTAPQQVPSPNPVNVTVRYDHIGGTAGSVILVGQVTILGDEPPSYSGTMTFTDQVAGVYAVTGTAAPKFTLEESLPGDLARYSLSQTITAKATLPGCDQVDVQIPVTGTLIVFDAVRQGASDPHAGKYQLGLVGSSGQVTFHCGGAAVPAVVPFELSTDCNDIASAPSWTDNGHLQDTASPNCPSFSAVMAWDLTTP